MAPASNSATRRSRCDRSRATLGRSDCTSHIYELRSLNAPNRDGWEWDATCADLLNQTDDAGAFCAFGSEGAQYTAGRMMIYTMALMFAVRIDDFVHS